MNWEIICDDVIHWAENYDGPKAHALLCDPPYHLGQNGFMGSVWDAAKYGISFNPDTWAALAEHLLPGAFGAAFASSRGWHRLAVAIEDAGLRIHPSIFGWANGAGFPKASRIGERVRNDNGKLKLIEDERFAGHRYGLQAMKPALEPIIVFQKPYSGKPVDSITETGAGSLWIDGARIGMEQGDQKGEFGHHKPQYLGRETTEGIYGDGFKRVNANQLSGRWPSNFILQHLDDHNCTRCSGKWPECPDCHGTGTVMGCRRVGTKRVRQRSGNVKGTEPSHTGDENTTCYGEYGRVSFQCYADADGLEETAAWECARDSETGEYICPVARLGEQAGPSEARPVRVERIGKSGDGKNKGLFGIGSIVQSGYYDKDASVSRFFFQSDWSYEIAERLANADPVRYQAKASSREREKGLRDSNECVACGCVSSDVHILDTETQDKLPAEMAGTNGIPTLDEIKQAAQGRWRIGKCRRNNHSTIKPLSLCKWLATLLLPPPEYAPRRILIPFSGTSSEGIGAMLAGWEEIVMIENESEYIGIAEARLRHWAAQPEQMELERRHDRD